MLREGGRKEGDIKERDTVQTKVTDSKGEAGSANTGVKEVRRTYTGHLRISSSL